MFKKAMMVSAFALVGVISVSTAHAETTTTTVTTREVVAPTVQSTTVTQQQDVPGAVKINFMDFDVNKDGILSMAEVGKKLFYIFDIDGNETIDNIEFTNNKIMTIIPMESKTITMVDFNNDGIADEKSYSYEAFLDQSGLAVFDKDKDGLSAKDFIGKGYQELDIDDNNWIEPGEWDKVYAEQRLPKAAENERYSQ